MLNVADVDDLVLQGGHLVPGEAALRGLKIERIHAGIDHAIAIGAVFEKVGASERLARLGRTVSFPRYSGDVLGFLAMARPRTKTFLSLLKIKMGKEKRVIDNSPERS